VRPVSNHRFRVRATARVMVSVRVRDRVRVILTGVILTVIDSVSLSLVLISV